MSIKDQREDHASPSPVAGGPLRMRHEKEHVFVTGFGLCIEAQDEEEGRRIIEELEQAGYRQCV